MSITSSIFFFFNDTATTEIYTLSLHDALPIYTFWAFGADEDEKGYLSRYSFQEDRKSTRLNSSHSQISYAVFCLKKKKKLITLTLSKDLLFIHAYILYLLSHLAPQVSGGVAWS